jgi:hypothetical protein
VLGTIRPAIALGSGLAAAGRMRQSPPRRRASARAAAVKGRQAVAAPEHDGPVIEFPLSPRARRALWLGAWAAVAVGGALTVMLGGLSAFDAAVDAALSGRADPTAAPIVATAIGVFALVAGAAGVVYLVVRGGDPADAAEPAASGARPSGVLARVGALAVRQPLQASWVWTGPDAD